MDDLKNIKRVYMLGIGGIGMSALARYFKAGGAHVSGYDKTPSSLTDELAAEGIEVHFDPAVENVDLEADLYIYTPAIPVTHPSFEWVQVRGGRWRKRSEVLEGITAQTPTIAVAGTHGKTTTTAFLSHLLHQAGVPITAFVGGIMTNYRSNLITAPQPQYAVVEADEYDRSFLRLKPRIAVITSMDPDHLDIYGNLDNMRKDYRSFASASGKLLVHSSVAEEFTHPDKVVYGAIPGQCTYRYDNVRVEGRRFCFTVWKDNTDLGQFEIQLPGKHNIENALAALSVALELGVDIQEIRVALASFRGVGRRFERVLDTPTLSVIDDYAHHPREIEAAIAAARMLYPGGKLTVVFQPHLFTRTRDLEDGFVESLNRADEVILLPIYPAREEPIAGVSSDNLLSRLSLKTKLLVEKRDLVNAVLSLSPENVLMLGAGDIDRLVDPLVKALKNRINVE